MDQLPNTDEDIKNEPDAFELYQSRELVRNQWLAAVAIIVSGYGTVILGLTAHGSMTNLGVDNYADLFSLYIGCPFLILQVLLLSPLAMSCTRIVQWHRPGRNVLWIYFLAILLPMISLTAIIIGLTDHRHPANP